MRETDLTVKTPSAAGPPRTAAPAAVPPPPAASRSPGWTGGRITATVIGALVVLVSLGLLGCGFAALWADRTQRDAAGYVTTDVHGFSTAGSALATEPIELGSPGVGWLYSRVVLGKVRIRVTPVTPGPELFVGIGPTAEVDRYLAGVGHTQISDFWSGRAQAIAGAAPGALPGTQDFWVTSAAGQGSQTLTWDPANGSWTVVVMHTDGGRVIDVSADLGAKMPALLWVAVFSLVVGAIFAAGGVLLIVGAIRRAGTAKAV
jgi:hypothetical protein